MLEKLYKKKVIRSFLSLYSEKYWTQLVSHILEYGIILFKKKYTVSALSPEDICQIVESLKKDEHIYDNIKTLKKTNNSKSSRQSSLSKGKGNSLSKGKGSFYGSTNRVRNGSSSVNSQSNSAKKGINGDTHSKKNIHNIRKAQTPSRQRSTDMFKFKANAGGNNVNSSNSNSNNNKYKTNFQSSSNSNSSKNIKTQSFVQQRPKSKTRTSKGVGSNEFLGHNTSNASSRKTILSMTQTSNLEGNHNKNNTSIISAYSCYTTDINNNNNNSNSNNNMMTIKHKQGNNAFQSTTHVSTSTNNNNNNVDDNKLIHFSNSNNDYSNKQPKLKAESKIKALIENDKKKYMQQQKYTNLSGTLKPLSTENSNIDIGEVNYVVTEKPIIDNLNTNTNPIKEDEYDEHHNNNINNSLKSKTTTYPIKNESSIISLEDKLNGLTMKLSKLNASINNNNSTLQNMQPLNNTSHQLINNNNNIIPSSATLSYPSYLKSGINYRLDNLELNIGNTPLHTNQFINTTEGNNDEDYLGEDQIDLVGGSRTGMNIAEESNNGDNMEMRCYRRTQDDNNSNH